VGRGLSVRAPSAISFIRGFVAGGGTALNICSGPFKILGLGCRVSVCIEGVGLARGGWGSIPHGPRPIYVAGSGPSRSLALRDRKKAFVPSRAGRQG
jgi:hypothetical protein